MALLDLTFTEIKYICTRLKTDYNNINFGKLYIGQHMAFNDEAWDYWIYDSWTEMNQVWPQYYYDIDQFIPDHQYGKDEYM